MINEQALQAAAGRIRPFKRFAVGISGAVTGVAPVQAIPTTAAQWALVNVANVNTAAAGGAAPTANPGDSDTLFIEELGAVLVSGTPGLGASVWACIFTAPINGAAASHVAPVNYAGGALSSGVVVTSGVTISAPAAPAWFPVFESWDPIAAAAFSTGYSNSIINRRVRGLAVPPGSALGIAVIAPAGTTPLYAPYAKWTEQQAAVS